MKKSIAPEATAKKAKTPKAAKPVKASKTTKPTPKAAKPVKASKAAKPTKPSKKATPPPPAKKLTKTQAKAAAKQAALIPAPVPQRETKKGQALQMLEEGTTIKALQERFGWLPHTTRGFLSVLRHEHPLNIELKDGVRLYTLKP